MAYQTKNIIVGAAAIYVSKTNSTEAGWSGASDQTIVAVPTLTVNVAAGAAFDASADWTHVGFTSAGIELSYEPTFGEVAVDQLLDTAKMFKSGMKASVKTTLAEATLENLVVAWGQTDSSLAAGSSPDTTGQELSIAGGALYDEPVERSVAFIGPAPRTSGTGKKRERLYFLRRALNVAASAHALKKDAMTDIPVDLRLLADPYYSGKEYGIIRDRQVEV